MASAGRRAGEGDVEDGVVDSLGCGPRSPGGRSDAVSAVSFEGPSPADPGDDPPGSAGGHPPSSVVDSSTCVPDAG
ncbi:MAG: hypothetical protein AAF211_04140 [Myxococcota bacterium]